MIELAGVRRRFGYRRLQLLLEREGHRINHKRIYRLYRSAGLAVRRRKRRAHIAVERQPLVLPLQANETWSMDFVFDALSNGRKLRTLTFVDDCTKECVEIGVDTRINGEAVTRILDCAIRFRGKPKSHSHRPGSGIHRHRAEQVGTCQRHRTAADPARKADAERVHRKLQRQVPRRVPQRAVLHHDGTGTSRDCCMAPRLQRATPAHSDWRADTFGIREGTSKRTRQRKAHQER